MLSSARLLVQELSACLKGFHSTVQLHFRLDLNPTNQQQQAWVAAALQQPTQLQVMTAGRALVVLSWQLQALSSTYA